MVSPQFRDKAVSRNTGSVEKVFSLLSMQLLLHKATRADADNLQQQQQEQQKENMMNMADDGVNHGIIVESHTR